MNNTSAPIADLVLPRPSRPVPQLTAAQIALHAGITRNSSAFSLEQALALYRRPAELATQPDALEAA